MQTEKIIMGYWKSWQSHSNWSETRNFLADDFKFDAGTFSTNNADELVEMMKKGNPWKDIKLLDSVITENKGALLYEGTDSVTNTKFRVTEIITVKEDKVISCFANITQISNKA